MRYGIGTYSEAEMDLPADADDFEATAFGIVVNSNVCVSRG